MVFEDYYDDFFKTRGSLEDPYRRITISREEYNRLKDVEGTNARLVKKIDQVEAEKSALHKQLIDLKDDGRKLKELQEQTEKYLNSLVRVQADFDNYKKSVNREKENYQNRFRGEILAKLIDHYEDLLRAQQTLESSQDNNLIIKGFEMVVKKFELLLTEQGVKPMNVEGQKFDPYKHEALMVQETDELPENTIIEEIDKGYYIDNKILKPAGVKVSKLKSKL